MRGCLILLFAAASAFAADTVSGTWKIEGDVAGNAINHSCTLKQEGAKLTGSCAAEAGKVEVTGEVDGQKVTFKHGGDYQGTALTVIYTGTIGDDGVLKGTINVQPFDASGDFTAKKTD